jgi:hypothetical protein
LLKPSCHILFMHTLTALRCTFDGLDTDWFTNLSSLKMHRISENACGNGMWKQVLSWLCVNPIPKSLITNHTAHTYCSIYSLRPRCHIRFTIRWTALKFSVLAYSLHFFRHLKKWFVQQHLPHQEIVCGNRRQFFIRTSSIVALLKCKNRERGFYQPTTNF